jgi:AcrR family transcriptional regulator
LSPASTATGATAAGNPASTGAGTTAGPALTRRERHRQATYDEIVSVARALLRSSSTDLSLRAVAAEMGMTPPALYRYVDSYAELLVLVARAVFADVVASMTVARNRYPDDDPAAQIVASAAAFRRWALGNPAEFRLVFATPLPDESDADTAPGSRASATRPGTFTRPEVEALAPCVTDNGADLFAGFFSEIFGRLWAKYQFPVPADEDLHPAVLAVLRADLTPATVTDGFGAITPGMVWMFERAWARLYGTVTLEVFGHVHPEFIRSGALFESTMLDVGRDLGLADEWDRLVEAAREEPTD